MMTVSALSGAQGAAEYLSKDGFGEVLGEGQTTAGEYYTNDSDIGAAQWHGKLAEELGLTATDRTTLENTLRGQLPDGTQLPVGPTGERAPGWDATFSAPKSVSIQALVAGDERIIKAHDEAVKTALNKLEENVDTRVKSSGKVSIVNSANAAIFTVRHDTSRELEPQLHTHSAIMNMTKTDDGKIRAMESRDIFASQKELGELYRRDLAERLEQIGYQIDKTQDAKDGFNFELKGIGKELRDEFSSRSKQIEAYLVERGLTRETATSAEKETAALATRKGKEIPENRAVLQQEWRSQAAAHGYVVDNNKQETVLTTSFDDKQQNHQADSKTTSPHGFDLSQEQDKQAPSQDKSAVETKAEKLHGQGNNSSELREPIAQVSLMQEAINRASQPDYHKNLEQSRNEYSDKEVVRTIEKLSENSAVFAERDIIKDVQDRRGDITEDRILASLGRFEAKGDILPREMDDKLKKAQAVMNEGVPTVKMLVAYSRAYDGQSAEGMTFGQVREALNAKSEIVGTLPSVDSKNNEPTTIKAYTTKKQVELETGMIKSVMRMTDPTSERNKAMAVMTEKQADDVVTKAEKSADKAGFSMTDEQKSALKGVLSDKQQLHVVQGLAGTAKTTSVLKNATSAMQEAGFTVTAAAPTSDAASKLQSEIKANNGGTLQKLVAERGMEKLATGSARDHNAWQKSMRNKVNKLEAKALDADRKIVQIELKIRDRTVSALGFKSSGRFKSGFTKQRQLFEGAESQLKAAKQIRGWSKQQKTLHKESEKVRTEAQGIKDALAGKSKEVIILDEAGMADSKMTAALNAYAERTGTRIVSTGDVKQHGSVGAGEAFKQTQEATKAAGGKVHELKDIKRQTNEQLKSAVYDTTEAKIKEALHKIENGGGSITEIADRGARIQQIAKDYTQLTPEQRDKTLVVDPSKESGKQLTEAIRDKLKDQGELSNEKQYTTWQSKEIEGTEYKHADRYAIGDQLRDRKTGEITGTVTAVDLKTNLLTIEAANKGTKVINAGSINEKRTDVGRMEEKGFAVGDKVRMNAKSSIGNKGTQAQIISHTDKGLRVKTANGKVETLSHDQVRDVGHGYVTTSHKSQGQTVEKVMVNVDSRQINLANQQTTYVALSRAKQEAHVYTDKVHSVAKTIENNDGKSGTAIKTDDVVKEVNNTQQQVKTLEMDSAQSKVVTSEITYQRSHGDVSPPRESNDTYSRSNSDVSPSREDANKSVSSERSNSRDSVSRDTNNSEDKSASSRKDDDSISRSR